MCSRASAPEHRLWVTNRTSQRYLAVDVTPTLELQSRGDLFLLRDTAHPERGLHAIWSPEEDKANAAILLDSFRVIVAKCAAVADGGGARETTGNGAVAARAAAGVDAGSALLNMLMKKSAANAPAPTGAPAANVNVSAGAGAGAGALPPSVAAFFPVVSASATAPSTISPSVAALFSSTSAAASAVGTRGGVGSDVSGGAGGAVGSDQNGAPPHLNKAALRSALLDLVNDDTFLTLLHSRYAKAVQQHKK